jgi:hypothetical protein
MDTKDFAMFSDAGNAAVAKIVELSKTHQLSWTTTYSLLQALGQDSRFAESMDTMVREIVYEVLGFNEDFYI